MISLINVKNDKLTTDFVYIGRKNYHLGFSHSKWANPFPMKNERQRTEVLINYLEYVIKQPDLIRDLHELDNQKLGCYCVPKKCHGMILIMLRELQILGNLSDLSGIYKFIRD